MFSADAEFRLFVRLARDMEAAFGGVPETWRGSPFAWILRLPSRRRGKVGEMLVEAWCRAHGLVVQPAPDPEADRLIEGRRVEIKFSTPWNEKEYVFQQIRDQRYDWLFLLGLSPGAVHAWLAPKREGWAHAAPQHGGRRGTDTRWLRIRPDAPPAWLDAYGGTPADVLAILDTWKKDGG